MDTVSIPRDLLERLIDAADDHRDVGARDEGWQSQELKKTVSQAKKLLENAKLQ